MSQIDDINKDNQIADFADKALQGKLNQTASTSDTDMIHLEETILRLKNNVPTKTLDSASSKQMLVRLKARIKREEEAPKVSIWKKLFDFQSNPQVGMILAVATILILAVVSIPSLQFGEGTIAGTASNTNGILIAGVVLGLIFVVYWFTRRK